MVTLLANAVIIGALLLALLSLINAFRDRPVGPILLGGLTVVELALLIQAGLTVVGMIMGSGPEEKGVLVGYLIGTVLIPPAAAYLALTERTRWGSVVVVVGAFAIAAMTGRLLQVWQGPA